MFGVTPDRWSPPEGSSELTRNLATAPVALRVVPDARPLHDDWVVTRPRLTGVCGSDAKQILGDFGDDSSDSALSGLCSFPQIMGHEVVADVVTLGPAASGVEVGQRMVLNPWLSCVPRGITPVCPACAAGDLSLCWSFTTGDIGAGIHTGTSRDASGGYAELMPAHPSMLFAVPDALSDAQAVLADPFSVSLHSVTRHPPPPDGRVVIWGAGALGLCALAILRVLHPDVRVAVVARFDTQADLALHFGAEHVVRPGSQEQLIGDLAAWSGGELKPTMEGLGGLPMCLPGHIDVAYDTIGKAETFEVEVRVLAARATLVASGVHAPSRWEWSPHYFKEISIVGSNAFGIEEVDGVRRHAIDHYLDLATAGDVDVTPLITHNFALTDWHDAFGVLADQAGSGAVKVTIDPRSSTR